MIQATADFGTSDTFQPWRPSLGFTKALNYLKQHSHNNTFGSKAHFVVKFIISDPREIVEEQSASSTLLNVVLRSQVPLTMSGLKVLHVVLGEEITIKGEKSSLTDFFLPKQVKNKLFVLMIEWTLQKTDLKQQRNFMLFDFVYNRRTLPNL